ncbi:MAG: TonB family protein [Phycisphaerales bacterium]|nr:TonB family protein [Hyphomonadaceae bacterium]
MAHALGIRATSVVASSALLGMAAIAAFTMTLVQHPIVDFPDSVDPIEIVEVQPTVTDPPLRTQPASPLPRLADFSFDQLFDEIASPPILTILPAGAGGGAGLPSVIDPEWVRVPRDLARYYPERALVRGIEGSVTLNCIVDTRGGLDCAVMSVTPANWGFAQAALRISGDYQMVPATRDGMAVEARHRMVIPFRLQ